MIQNITYDSKYKKNKYPIIKTNPENECSVLFIGTRTGSVINSGKSGFHVGLSRNDWEEEKFTDFTDIRRR